MRKADSLRAHLTNWLPDLKRHPDRLAVYIEGGAISARQSKTPSFAYSYTIKAGLWDFAGSADTIVVAVLAWIEREQPQLLRRADSQPFSFEAELLDSTAYDILLSIDVAETVLVLPGAGGFHVEHPPEPDFTDAFAGINPAPLLWQGFAGTELLVESQDPAATLTPSIPPAS